jgi:ankyrin repeat protein
VSQALDCKDDTKLANEFLEAAQRGHIIAVDAWYHRVHALGSFDRILCQALDWSCAKGHIGMAAYLLERGADVEAQATSPSLDAIKSHPDGLYLTGIPDFGQPHGGDGIDGVSKEQSWPRPALHACLQATPQCDRVRGLRGGNFEGFRKRKRSFISKQKDIIQLLLRNGAEINTLDKHGRSALHYAALHCTVETTQVLLDHGAAIDLMDDTGRKPLQYAAWREVDSLPVFLLLIKAEERSSKTPIIRPVYTPLLESALSIFERGCEGFIEAESVHDVLVTGPGAVVRWLLQSDPQLQASTKGFVALLHLASADGDADFVQLLIERNVYVKGTERSFGTPLQTTVHFSQVKCMKLLVNAGATIGLSADDLGNLLYDAVESQDITVVQFLLSLNEHVDLSEHSVDRARSSVSTSSSAMSNSELAKTSPSQSVKPGPLHKTMTRNYHSGDMSRALHRACRNGCSELVQLLLVNGADLERKSSDSPSPLVSAARGAGSIKTMEVLIAAGAAVYDVQRSINVWYEALANHCQMDTANFVFIKLLGTDSFIPACEECPTFIRRWQEDVEFVLHVDSMSKSDILLANVTALGAQRSIDLLLEDRTDSTDMHSFSLHAYEEAA